MGSQAKPPSSHQATKTFTGSELAVVVLMAMIQFINILEFMIVMPLGPDFSDSLGIPLSHIGYIGGSYTAAASFSGILASLFIERFDRKRALLVSIAGLLLATVAAGAAVDFSSLLAARIAAGVFGGPASALTYAIVTDVVPQERRGRALGIVMMAFSMASVAGVPLGLELAHLASWRLPLFSIAGLGVLVLAACLWLLPSMRGHLSEAPLEGLGQSTFGQLKRLLMDSRVLLCFLLAVSVMMGVFLMIPSIAPFVIANLGYPRQDISRLYLAGGLLTFVFTYFVGRLVDRWGPLPVGSFGTGLLVAASYLIFISDWAAGHVMLLFAVFMVSSVFRSIPYQTLLSMVPRPFERARFMSLQSSVQHVACALGAFTAAAILGEDAQGRLMHMDRVALISICINLCAPFLMLLILRRVRAGAPPSAPADVPAA